MRRALRAASALATATAIVAAPSSTPAATLAYATYLGGSLDDADYPYEGIAGVAVDGAGNVYVTGTTQSPDFPTTAGADRTLDGEKDVFVTKLSPSGAVLYSTFFGGACDDVARDIAVDTAGNAYVTGRFNGGLCYGGTTGALVAKLDPSGAVVYASVLGGRLADVSIGRAIAVDAAGHAYVAGVANSDTHDFPTTAGAFRTTACVDIYGNGFAGDGFVAKLSADGESLVYSTILCGSGDDSVDGIAIDAAGNAYVAGTTASSDFPLEHPYQTTRGGGPVGVTGFVTKLTPDGAHLAYSTYLGGSESTAVGGIAVDAQGSAYVTGDTDCDDFPTTPGVLQEHAGNRSCIEGCTDAFVTKLAPSGSTLAYSTYLFGELDDWGARIAVDAAGRAYVVGATNSANFPIVAAFQSRNRGLDDAFVAELSADGRRLLFSSYLGGSRAEPSPGTGVDEGTSLALDPSGNAWVVGYTQSYDFPTTAGALQPTLGAGICDFLGTPCGDAFVAKINTAGPGAVPPTSLVVTPSTAPPGGTVTATWAGIPIPSGQDHIRLYELGSPDGYPGEILAWWPTTGAAAGSLLLALPTGLPLGWYELRLYSPDPSFSGLPVMVARSEPIRVEGSAAATATATATRTATPTQTATPVPSLTPTPTSAAATPIASKTVPPTSVIESTATPIVVATSTFTPAPTATPSDAVAAAKCHTAITVAGSALLQAQAKALGTCESRIVSGKVTRGVACRDEPKTAAIITKARQKLARRIAKACGGTDKVCGTGGDDVSLANVAWDVGSCANVADASCHVAIGDCSDVATCVGCATDLIVDRAITSVYAGFVPSNPKAKAEKAVNKCQATIGRAAVTLLVAASKSTAHGADAVAKATAKQHAAICKACGGADHACGGDDDLTPAAIGFAATCTALAPSCAGAVAALEDLAQCIACVAETTGEP